MENYQIILKKLESFIRKFYLNELLKGGILFLSFGLLYFLFTLFIEYFLWLKPTGRSVLFWSFVLIEGFLFTKFIVIPGLKLLRLSGGIDHSEASKIIGRHFPSVNDKLLNVLQLGKNERKTELLLASIDQKSAELKPVPFSVAIDLRKNLHYLKYALIPLAIVLLIFFTGRAALFSNSYERVVNYNLAYEAPAAFKFVLENTKLQVLEGDEFTIRVQTLGKVVPENVSIRYNEQTYFLGRKSPGVFEYTFEPVQESFSFQLSGNEVTSPAYEVEVLKVPKTTNLKMVLEYPGHTKLGSEIIEGTGNATVPEGTRVKWEVRTEATEAVEIQLDTATTAFSKEGNLFHFERDFFSTQTYGLQTSNADVKNYEHLRYTIQVVKDEFPQIMIEKKDDSLNAGVQHFHGQVLDDYWISLIRLVAYPEDEPQEQIIEKLASQVGSVSEFFYSFPGSLDLERGKSYSFYFEVIDNDKLNGFKSKRSAVFSYRHKTVDELEENRMLEQKEAIKGLDESLDRLKNSELELSKISDVKKEKNSLSFMDRKRLEEFLKRKEQQQALMRDFTQKLKKNLETKDKEGESDLKKELEERISKREEEIEENEEILEELEKYSEMIREEGLSEKLEELSRNIRNQEKNLEVLLELTKRYYVQQKVQRIAEKLEELADEQKEISGQESDNTLAKQDSISEKTKEAFEEIEELNKENSGLKQPMDLNRNESLEKEILDDQKNASEDLKESNKKEAEPKQKKAGEKLQEMASSMKREMQSGSMERMEEDAGMLRQILDNLLSFSFEQEDLMEDFRRNSQDNFRFAAKLRKQNSLKENFQHIDDSLYSLALRNPMINELIINKLSDVDYNLEQSLERFGRNEINPGVGSQQYVITGANELAYLLSDVLSNMEQMLSQAGGNGSGKSGEMQLPDIIEKQGQLNEKMNKAMEDKQRNGEGDNSGGEKAGEELFQIFQEQQLLRMALEEKLKNEGGSGKDVQEDMKKVEKQLLDKAFDPEVHKRMLELEHKLMDLEDALLEQSKKEERESKSFKGAFENELLEQERKAKDYFNTTKILNRQSLPLRQIYKIKVKEYFERREN